MPDIQSVCVYCASSDKCDSYFLDSAYQLGAKLADEGMEIVYGGGSTGLMGRLADGALAHNGRVTGIIPRFMQELEWGHTGITKLHEVENMHARKHMMMISSQGIIALPGGCGTLEELLEAITWKRLGLLRSPIIIANLRGFYTPLLHMLESTIEHRFMRAEHRNMWSVADSIEQIIALLRQDSPLWPEDARSFAQV